jgi:hypothetical protein
MAENEKHERKPLIKSGATRSFTPQDSQERQDELQKVHVEELKERLKEREDAEKQAEKDAKEAEKQAEKAAKEAEKEASEKK